MIACPMLVHSALLISHKFNGEFNCTYAIFNFTCYERVV